MKIFSLIKSIEPTKIMKIAGYAMSGAGTLLIGAASKRENDKLLEKLVEEKTGK